MVSNYNDWLVTSELLAQGLRKFQRGELSLEELDTFLSQFENKISDVIIDDVFDISTEIGGAPNTFGELVKLLTAGISEEKIIEWLEH